MVETWTVKAKRRQDYSMKKLTHTILTILLILILSAHAHSAVLKPYAFPFIGRWQPSEDPLLIDDYGFQDIQNLRKDGNRLKGVTGHTALNSTIIDSTYFYPINGFHFYKDQPSETHVLVQAENSGGTASILYQNTTAIPSTGDFSTTALYTDDTSATIGRFSDGPRNSMFYCNGVESLIWSGDEANVSMFVASSAAVVNTISDPRDFTRQVINSSSESEDTATVGDPVDSSTVLLMHCAGLHGGTTFTDSSTTPHTPVGGGGDEQTSQYWKKFGTASLALDGTGDYVTIPDSADFDMDTGDFTIDFWIRANDLDTSYDGVFSQRADDNNKVEVYAKRLLGALYINFIVTSGGSELINALGVDDVLAEQAIPIHVAIVKSTDTKIYLNGNLVETDTTSYTYPDIAGAFEIGRAYTGAAWVYLDGNLDEIRISKGIARWTSDFSVPTSPYGDSASYLYWMIGTTRPIQGAKYYLSNINTETSPALTVKEWIGTSWSDLTVTDNTSGLTSSGTITWSSTVNTSKPRYLYGNVLYWYQFYLSKGNATIYNVTIDAPMQTVKNLWNGANDTIVKHLIYKDATGTTEDVGVPIDDLDIPEDIVWGDYYAGIAPQIGITKTARNISSNSGSYEDSTISIQSDIADTVADLSSLGTDDYLLFGFLTPMQAFNIRIVEAKGNDDATVLTVSYWDGSQWVVVDNLNDQTDVSGDSFKRSGVISFNPVQPGQEFTQTIGDEFPLYYYKLNFTAAHDAEVELYNVTGTKATLPISTYKFPIMFQERMFLLSDIYGDKNKAIYSAWNSPDVWNGDDSSYLLFGDGKELVAAGVIYNMFNTTGIPQLIVMKKNSTYRLVGDNPTNWVVQELSGITGCIAPLSVALCETKTDDQGFKRQVLIWQASHGVVMCDGASIVTISKDIQNYFDPNSSEFIPTAVSDNSIGWYDPDLESYKLLISSGSGQTTHDVELEYSLRYNEWTKIYRENGSGANPLQIAFPVFDTDGKRYIYGMTDEGIMYRLENGDNWESTAIAQYVHTKDLIIDDEMPSLKNSTIEYFRLNYEIKATASTEDVSIAHYCDRELTVDGTDDQLGPSDIDIATGPYDTQDVMLGQCLYHSFKFSANITGTTDGIELTAMSLWAEVFDTIFIEE